MGNAASFTEINARSKWFFATDNDKEPYPSLKDVAWTKCGVYPNQCIEESNMPVNLKKLGFTWIYFEAPNKLRFRSSLRAIYYFLDVEDLPATMIHGDNKLL